MTITLRNTKGQALTFNELDGNFTDLDSRILTQSQIEGFIDSSYIKGFIDSSYLSSAAATRFLDSADAISLIDSAYVNARADFDSGEVVGIIDSNYIQQRTRIGLDDIDFGMNKITYANMYSNLVDLPNATTYHGMFAHVHGQGKAYYAHAGNWVQLADKSETLDSYYTSALIDSAYVNSKFDGTVDPKFTDFLFTVDSGTTTITGLSDAGDSLSIRTNNFAVFLNGIKLQDTDFVDSSANNRITLNNALDSADEILVQTVTSTRTSSLPAILGTVDSAYIQQRLTEMVPASSTFSTFRYVSTEGQSVYTGNDVGGSALSYDSAQVQVFLNGLLLTKTEDFTLQNKNQITLQDSVNSGSEIVINNYATSFRAREDAAFSDSAAVTNIIDSDYVQARALGGGVTYNATSSNITLEKGNAYIVDTSSARTLTLPATGTLGDEIKIIDGTGQAGTNNITINRNGHKIQGLTDNLVINISRAATGLVYYNAAQGWILTEN